MELSPQAVAAATFKTVKRGYDPDEVRAYLVEVSASLEASHQQATAMEARARAAIAKLQDATQHASSAPSSAPLATADEAETISRTLLLAQRTADATVAEAKAEADKILSDAKAEAEALRTSAGAEAAAATSGAVEQADRLLREAQAEADLARSEAIAAAERAKSEAHLRAEAEVARLEQQREALLGDVSTLEHHVGEHRERLRSTSVALAELADRVPNGLGELARPTLSATVITPAPASSPTPASGIPSSSPTLPSRTLNGGNGAVPAGAEPLVSPRPTSIDEVRSTWAQADQDEQLIDATPTPSGGIALPPPDATPAVGVFADESVDATPPAGIELDEG